MNSGTLTVGRVAAVLLAAGIATASAQEGGESSTAWKSKLTITPGSFPAPRPLQTSYVFKWTGIEAGRGDFTFSRPSSRILQLDAEVASSGMARVLWSVDAKGSATAHRKSLRPIQFEQKEVYRKETRHTKVSFFENHVMREFHKTPSKTSPGKPKRIPAENANDVHSALLLLRSLPLHEKEEISMVALPSRQPYLATVKVEGREKIRVPAGEYASIRLDLSLVEIDKKGNLLPTKRVRRTTGWLSDDKDRLLLRIESEVFVGTVVCELTAVHRAP